MLLPQVFIAAVMALVLLVAVLIIVAYFKIWFRAYMADVPIGLSQILSMTFRKIDPKPVVSALIVTRQAGIELSCGEVESAYMRGADVARVAAALVAQKEGKATGNLSFEDLVEADLQD